MNYQRDRTLLETTTAMAQAEVLAAAKEFFSRRVAIYSAFVEKESDTHVAMRGQGGEEVIIGVRPAAGGGTAVTGSSYLFEPQISRFFTTLPPAPEPSVEAGGAETAEQDAVGGTSA